MVAGRTINCGVEGWFTGSGSQELWKNWLASPFEKEAKEVWMRDLVFLNEVRLFVVPITLKTCSIFDLYKCSPRSNRFQILTLEYYFNSWFCPLLVRDILSICYSDARLFYNKIKVFIVLRRAWFLSSTREGTPLCRSRLLSVLTFSIWPSSNNSNKKCVCSHDGFAPGTW